MMERKRAFRSGIVLLELMASILIFALAGAVCVQVLMKAETMATQAQNLNDGVNYVSSAAEIIRSADSNEEAMSLLQQAWPEAQETDGLEISFPNGRMKIVASDESDLWLYQLKWVANDDTVYYLPLTRCYQEVTP